MEFKKRSRKELKGIKGIKKRFYEIGSCLKRVDFGLGLKKTRIAIFYSLDLIISVVIILTAISALFLNFYTKNYEYSDNVENSIDILLQEGYPENWNSTNVLIPGILTNKTLNDTKFLSLKEIGYDRLRALLGLNNDYFIILRNITGGVALKTNPNVCGYGLDKLLQYNCSPELLEKEIHKYKDVSQAKRVIAYPPILVEIVLYSFKE